MKVCKKFPLSTDIISFFNETRDKALLIQMPVNQPFF